MKSSAKRDNVIIIIATVLLFLICALITIFTDIFNNSFSKPSEPVRNYDESDYWDITYAKMDYVALYNSFKECTKSKEEYLRQHSDMSEEELSKDKEYTDLCELAEKFEREFLQIEQDAYDKYKIENFGEKAREWFKVHTYEEDKAIERRNTILKWTLPFAAAILCGLIIVLVLRRRKKNERIYWEKQEEKKKMRETEAS